MHKKITEMACDRWHFYTREESFSEILFRRTNFLCLSIKKIKWNKKYKIKNTVKHMFSNTYSIIQKSWVLHP